MARLLELAGVEYRHRIGDGGFVLRIPALTITAGEHVVVMGPSGSGKSTLLDLLSFLAAPTACSRYTLWADEREYDIANYWRAGRAAELTRLRARYIGYVLQTGGLLPYLGVMENILLSRRLLGLPIPGAAQELIAAVELSALVRRKPAQLSVGQRQRVAVVRAVAHEPLMVLADEPTASLDGGLAVKVLDALMASTRHVGATLCIATHDLDVARRVGGRIIHCRPSEQVTAAETIVG